MKYKQYIINNIEQNIDAYLDDRKRQLNFWLKWGKNDNCRTIIFGAALMGEKSCCLLEKMGVTVHYICDNNPAKWGQVFKISQDREIEIISPQEAFQFKGDVLCFIAVGVQFWSQLKGQLKEYNIRHIICEKYLPLYLESMEFFLSMSKNEILDKIKAILELFEDDESLEILWCHLREIFGIKKVDAVLAELNFEKVCSFPQYFIDEGRYLGKQEVMVDCGAYNGDTLISLIEEVKFCDFEKYLCFELDYHNFKFLEDTVNKMPKEIRQKIRIFNCGVGREEQHINYNFNTSNSSIMLNGSMTGKIVSLDKYLQGENITFLKMDIEGSEQEALQGAKAVIQSKVPICAICIYHSVKDFFQIPFLLKEFVPAYHLNLRHHSIEWCDTVCYAKVD